MISIVIATFNRKEPLRVCLDSVFRQTNPLFEVIVVDDCSTDDTWKMLSEIHDPRLRIFRLEKNTGAYAARNKGMDEMNGDYFFSWDSDDILYENAVDELYKAIELFKRPDMICTPTDFYLNGVLQQFRSDPSKPISYIDHLKNTLPKNEILMVLKSSVLNSKDRFLGPNIDYVFYLRASKKCTTLYHYDKILGKVILQSDAISETLARRKFNRKKSILRIVGLETVLVDTGEDMIIHAPKRYAGIVYGLGFAKILNYEWRSGVYWLYHAARYDRKYTIVFLVAAVPFSPVFFNLFLNFRHLFAFTKRK